MTTDQTNAAFYLETLEQKELAMLVPGFEVPLTDEEADRLGAFEETAVSYQDALNASFDLLEVDHDAVTE